MTNVLDRWMLKALVLLLQECDKQDRLKAGPNFVHKDKIPAGIGLGTLAKLLEYGLIAEGKSPWSDKEGYRITKSGRSAVE